MRNLLRRTAVLGGAVALLLGSGIVVAAAQPATQAVLTFTPGSHMFGNAAGSATFELENTGDRNSGGVKVTLSGSAEFTITATTCRGNLHPGETCMVTVAFTPTSEDEVTATLEATGNPHTVPGTAGLTGGTTATPVNCTAQPGTALQAAITAADPGAVLAVTGTCDGNFTIRRDLTIIGQPGATLDGEELDIVLTITGGADVTLTTLKITGGRGAFGGGIRVEESTVTLTGSTVTGNTATVAGGGIYNFFGAVTLNGSTVTGNTAGFLGGGGILNLPGGAVTLNGSTVTGNTPDNCVPSGSVSGCIG